MDLGGNKETVSSRLALTHYALGVNCFNSKDYEGSKVEFSRSIDYSNKIPDVYVNRARSCIELNENSNAIEDLEKAIQLNPSHQMAQSLL